MHFIVCVCVSNYHIAHFKLRQCYESIISVKLGKIKHRIWSPELPWKHKDWNFVINECINTYIDPSIHSNIDILLSEDIGHYTSHKTLVLRRKLRLILLTSP